MSLKQYVIHNIEKIMLDKIKKEKSNVINFTFDIQMDFSYFKMSKYKILSSLEFFIEDKTNELNFEISHNSTELEIALTYNNLEIFKLNETTPFCPIDKSIILFSCYMERIRNKPKNSYTIEGPFDNHITCLADFDLVLEYVRFLGKYTSLSADTYCKSC